MSRRLPFPRVAEVALPASSRTAYQTTVFAKAAYRAYVQAAGEVLRIATRVTVVALSDLSWYNLLFATRNNLAHENFLHGTHEKLKKREFRCFQNSKKE